MKLGTKLLLTIGVFWLCFFTASIVIFKPPLDNVLFLIGGGALLLLVIEISLRIWVLKPIETLANDIIHIGTQDHSKRLKDKRDDEISLLASKINITLNLIENSQERLSNRTHDRIEALHNTNVKLQQEITELEALEKDFLIHKDHLLRLAHYDTLTSLPNRIFFNEMFNKIISHGKRHNKIFALLFIDIDHFKALNDHLNQQAGDIVLKEIATRLLSILRTEDILARVGGDEFILLLNDISNPQIAQSVAGKIIEFCAKPIIIQSQETILSTSIGICLYPENGSSLEDLLKNADIAMHKAKRAGGGIYKNFTKEMEFEEHEQEKLESEMARAIHQNELTLYYQPKLHLKDGNIIGVEAFIRWEHAELGLLTPEKFIPLAEKTGHINQIDEWVLYEACRINQSWQDKMYEPITISINLSTSFFQLPDLVAKITNALEKTRLKPEYLEIEITEMAVLDHVDSAIQKMHALRKLGVQIAIDKFGTGFTSMSSLKQFPVSSLKIDKTLINGIPTHKDDTLITRAVISLAHCLDMHITAEGVENAEQLRFLAENECDSVQGYFLYKPIPETKMLSQLKQLGKTTNFNVT